jgi:O-antigen ligase
MMRSHVVGSWDGDTNPFGSSPTRLPSPDAPGWVKMMPNAHNDYIDTKLEMGDVGLAFLLAFLIATLHAVGRIADRDPTRARLVLSLALFDYSL